jgi:hypothetical protein
MVLIRGEIRNLQARQSNAEHCDQVDVSWHKLVSNSADSTRSVESMHSDDSRQTKHFMAVTNHDSNLSQPCDIVLTRTKPEGSDSAE